MVSDESRLAEGDLAIDIDGVLKRNYLVLTRLLVCRVLLSAVLIATPLVIWSSGGPNTTLTAVPIVPGVFLAVLTHYRIRCGVRLRQCALVLRHYPLEFCDSLEKKKHAWTEYGSVYTVRVTHEGKDVTPDMWARNAAGPSGWPKGLEQGVWFAGDAPFGGVIISPSSSTMMFMVPADWKESAKERGAASPERLEKARAAKIIERSWRRANLQT